MNYIIPNELGTISTKNIEIRINKIILEMINMVIDPMNGFIYHSFNQQEPIKSEGRVLRLELGKRPKEIECETFSPLWRFGHAEILLTICVVEYNMAASNGNIDDEVSDDEYSAEDYFVISEGPIDPDTGKVLTVCSVMQHVDPNVTIGQAAHTSKSVAAVISILDYLHEAGIVGKAKVDSVVNDITLMLNLIESEKVKPTKKNAEAERLAKNIALVNSQATEHSHIRHNEDAPVVVRNMVGTSNRISMYDRMNQRNVSPDGGPVAVIQRNTPKIIANTRKRTNNMNNGAHSSQKIINSGSQYYGPKNITNTQRINEHTVHSYHHNPHIQHHQSHNTQNPRPQGHHTQIVYSWDD